MAGLGNAAATAGSATGEGGESTGRGKGERPRRGREWSLAEEGGSVRERGRAAAGAVGGFGLWVGRGGWRRQARCGWCCGRGLDLWPHGSALASTSLPSAPSLHPPTQTLALSVSSSDSNPPSPPSNVDACLSWPRLTALAPSTSPPPAVSDTASPVPSLW